MMTLQGTAHWQRHNRAVVDSTDAFDALFTRLEAGSSDHPIMVDLVASDGRCLVVGLGGDKAVLSLDGLDGAPPYYATVGDVDAEGDITFDYGGEATVIQMRHAVPVQAARAAAAQFLREPGLPDSVRWEEV
jgi:hypothetical protein